MDYEKAVKNAKWFAIGILVLVVIAFCIRIFQGSLSLLPIVLVIAQLVVIIMAIKGLNDNQRYGAICGIIVSVLLMLTSNIIIFIFGILYLIDCIRLLNYMNHN